MQIELFSIDSPCIGVCTMNRQGYCIGCLRNRAERQAWHTLSDAQKHHIITLLARRRTRIAKHIADKRKTPTTPSEQPEFF